MLSGFAYLEEVRGNTFLRNSQTNIVSNKNHNCKPAMALMEVAIEHGISLNPSRVNLSRMMFGFLVHVRGFRLLVFS